jgi:hypothetical protein
MTWRAISVPAALAGAALLAHPAAAQESVYTSLDLAACAAMPAERAEAPRVWLCAGYADISVLVIEAEGHFYVSYGFVPDAEAAIYQTLEPVNTINDLLEWRLDAAGQPIATILRFFVTGTGPLGGEGEVLVVTRVQSPACHVAYVDARAVPDANDLARRAADLLPLGFGCDYGNTPLWFGHGGLPFFDVPGPEPLVIADDIRAFVRQQLGEP